MKMPKWLDRARREREAADKSIEQFKKTYIPFKTRQEMWAYLDEKNQTVWDYGSIPMTDIELSDTCMITAWMISND